MVKLPNTIQFLDSSIQTMRSHIESLKGVVTKFDSTLTALSNVSDKQITLIKETQNQWAAELAKKPYLILSLISVQRDSLNKLIITPQLSNLGNKFAKEITVVLKIPPQYNFQSTGWRPYTSRKTNDSWSIFDQGPIGPAIGSGIYSDHLSDFSIEVPNIEKTRYLKFYYFISYEFSRPQDSLLIPIPPPDSTINF